MCCVRKKTVTSTVGKMSLYSSNSEVPVIDVSVNDENSPSKKRDLNNRIQTIETRLAGLEDYVVMRDRQTEETNRQNAANTEKSKTMP